MAASHRQGKAENLYKRVGNLLPLNFSFMKKYLLGLFAVALAVGFSAFNAPTVKFGVKYMKFNSQSLSETRDGSKYEEIEIQELPECEGNQLPCVIEVPDTIEDPAVDPDELTLHLTSTYSTTQEVVDEAFAQRFIQ